MSKLLKNLFDIIFLSIFSCNRNINLRIGKTFVFLPDLTKSKFNKIYLPLILLLILKHNLQICFITEECIWISYGTCSYISTFPWRGSLFCSLDKQSNEWKCWGFEFFKKEMARVTITKELNVAKSASAFSKALFLPLKICNHSNMQYSGFLSGELANWSNSRFIEDQNEYNIYWV